MGIADPKPTATARQRVAAVLGGVDTPGSFSARRAAPVDDLRLEVRGLGPLAFPVSREQAIALCRLGRPARYGRGEQTLLDRRVRDTTEVPLSRVKLDKRQWNRTLLPVLDRLRRDLGLPAGCELQAELHSMLVYAAGQFFVPHQDSEKADAMVGTLVVTLPSSFTGGDLVVEHAGQRATYRSSRNGLSFVAFYADCLHQIRPVRSGHRIVLTYNLLRKGETVGPATIESPPGVVDAVARGLDEHFATPLPASRYDATPTDPPKRLVYLLDHEYTQRGLSWSGLKGSDAQRAGILREASGSADCDVVLALANINEVWSCSEPMWEGSPYGRGRRRWWDDGDDFDDFDGAEEDEAWSGGRQSAGTAGYELEELIDWSITLVSSIDPSGGKAQPIASSVADAEVCATTPSAELRPYSSDYEGYMGNYGNTMDRWYHRGAVVVWPRRHSFAVHAEAAPSWALDELSRRLRTGDVAGTQEAATALTPFWSHAVIAADPKRTFVGKALRVARGLDHPGLATMLLGPFDLEALARSHAPALAAVVGHYGEDWARVLVARWSAGGAHRGPSASPARLAWLESLASLCEALQAAGGGGTSTAELIVEDTWRSLGEAIVRRRDLRPPSHRDQALGELASPILALLESAALIGNTQVRDEALGVLCADDDDLLGCGIGVLRSADSRPEAGRTAAGLDAVARHCAARLQARLARPPRADDDWSIELPGTCGCKLCGLLRGFLMDPARRTYEWPLAKDGRSHLHSRIDMAELPVRHLTRRKGRPYTLVLTKTAALFESATRARHRDEADLAWLSDRYDCGAGSAHPG